MPYIRREWNKGHRLGPVDRKPVIKPKQPLVANKYKSLILKYVADNGEAQRFELIALGIEKKKASQLISELVEEGLLERMEGGLYRLAGQ